VTAKGANDFRYNRDIYHVYVPVKIAFQPHKNRDAWRIPAVTDPDVYDPDMYTLLPDKPHDGEFVPFAVAALRGVPQQRGVLPLLATDAAREAHVRDAGRAWLESDRAAKLKCIYDGVTDYWKIVRWDSPKYLVWDQTRPLRITRERVNVYDRAQPNTDIILERPLREFWCVPDNCWRPWDLHPGTFAKTGICAVNMLHACFVKRAKRNVVDAATGRKMRKDVYVYARTEEEIWKEMDEIFTTLGYVAGEFPFERDWRLDGCTSKMVIEFCKRNDIICHIYHSQVAHGNELEAWVPHNASDKSPRVDFFIRDSHCFWYGRALEARGVDCAPSAANAITQMWHDPAEDEPAAETALDREIMPIFRTADAVPPFSEWQDAGALMGAAPDFDPYVRPTQKRRGQSNGRHHLQSIYFFTTDLAEVEDCLRLRNDEKRYSIELRYGQSPDKPTSIHVMAKGCPRFIVRGVPKEYAVLAAICKTAVEYIGLPPDRQLVYRGETATQVCERLRLELSRPKRRGFTGKERQTILCRQDYKCANESCGVSLYNASSELDHKQPLADGGEDTLRNVDALCVQCHAQKSETERLCALHRKPLYSELSRDVLEGLFDAPRPKQLVFGDGEPDCLEVDIIGCRVNALVKGEVMLPVADVTHRIEPYDSTCERHVREGALYFIDAGPPAAEDYPLGIDARGLLYYGPAW